MAYPVDSSTSVATLSELPKPTAGAAEPVVLTSDFALHVAYYVYYGSGDAVALVTFTHPDAHYFGPPHVDAVQRHPLHSRGVDIYGAFEVHGSSWVRELQQIARHAIESRHFILTFHDSTFECIASGFSVAMFTGHPAEVIRHAHAQPV